MRPDSSVGSVTKSTSNAKSAKNANSKSTERSEEPARPLCLVVGVKVTDSEQHGIEEAVRLAHRVPGCALHLVSVMEDAPTREAMDDRIQRLQLYVDQKLRSLGGLAGASIGIHVRGGKPAHEIARFAHDVEADLIVLGHRAKHLVGHTATLEDLLGTAKCPVLVARSPHAERHPAAIAVPAIEPPCADCVQTRRASQGATWWCARHSEHAHRAHTYSYQRALPFHLHDSEVSPTGVDP